MKKIIALILSLAMLISLATAVCSAEAATTEQIEVWQIDFENQDYTQIFNKNCDIVYTPESNEMNVKTEWTSEGLLVTNVGGTSSQGRLNSKQITWKAGARYIFEYTWKANVAPKSSGYGLYWNKTVGNAAVSKKSSLKTDSWTTEKFVIDDITEDVKTNFFLLDWDKNVDGGASFIIKEFKITYIPASFCVYDELDLSRTDTVMSTGDIPVKIAVDGYKNGELVKQNATDSFITFESEDPSVASVDANGNVTAHKNGVVKINAKIEYLDISESVMFVVGDATENDCSTLPSNHSTKQTLADFGRSGSEDASYAFEGAGATEIIDFQTLNATGQTVALWFYDDGSESNKGTIRVYGSKGSGDQLMLNEWVAIRNNKNASYKGWRAGGKALVNDSTASVNASKGWHQYVMVNDGETLKIYIDGTIVLQGEIAAENKIISKIGWYEHSAPSGSKLYVDDIACVNINEPEIEVLQIDFENEDFTQIFKTTSTSSTRWTDEGLVVTNKSSQGRFNSKSLTFKPGYKYVVEYTWKAAEKAHNSYGLYWDIDSDKGTGFGNINNSTRSKTSNLKLDEWTTSSHVIEGVESEVSRSFFLLDWNADSVGSDIFVIKDFKITAIPLSLEVYDELSFSGSDTVLSTSDIPTKIYVDGYKNGELVKKDITKDCEFAVSNPDIATVDENGYITAHKNGIVIVTATHYELRTTTSIMYIVGNSGELDCETEPSGVAKASLSDFARTGSHSWLYTSAGEGDVLTMTKIDADKQVVSCWFYDDGPGTANGVIRAAGNTGSDGIFINAWVEIGSENYGGINGNGLNKEGLVIKNIPASKGWHQCVFVNDGEVLTAYVDNNVVLKGTIKAVNNKITALTWYENIITSGNKLYIDDIAYTDITVPQEPEISVETDVKSGGAIKDANDNVLFANSYVVYATVANWENIVNYGMNLKRVSDGASLNLASQYDNGVVVEKLGASEGKFAFKVYGKAIDENECTLTPYIITEEGTLNGNESAKFGGNE